MKRQKRVDALKTRNPGLVGAVPALRLAARKRA